MATKTLILRPLKVTCDDESLLTFVPDTTTLESAHLLINEEVADDNATYIKCRTPANSEGIDTVSVSYHFNYVKPIDMSQIVSVTYYSKQTRENAAVNNNLTYVLHLENDYNLSALAPGGASSFDFTFCSLYESDKESAIAEFDIASDFLVIQNLSDMDSNSKSSSNVQVTQAYIEIVYETFEIAHIKNDDTWNMVKCKEFYLKDNNAWTKLELPIENIFDDGSKYRIKEVD